MYGRLCEPESRFRNTYGLKKRTLFLNSVRLVARPEEENCTDSADHGDCPPVTEEVHLPVESNDPRTFELLLATLSESMRAQREIIELLRELREDIASLRAAPDAASRAEESLGHEVTSHAPSISETENEAIESGPPAADLPVLNTLVNADGSTVEIDERERVMGHLKVVD